MLKERCSQRICRRSLKHMKSIAKPIGQPWGPKDFPVSPTHRGIWGTPSTYNALPSVTPQIQEKPQPLGARYTHTLPQLPTLQTHASLKSPCSSPPLPHPRHCRPVPPRPTRAAGLKFPRRGRRARA